jgi:hypothetical protein
MHLALGGRKGFKLGQFGSLRPRFLFGSAGDYVWFDRKDA